MAAVLLVFWLAGEAVAQSGEGPVDSPTEGSIGLLLEEERRPKAGIFAYGPVSLIDQPWQEFNDWLEQTTRFRLGLDNTLVVQQATNGPGDRTGASGELNLFGKGRLIGTSDQDYAGYLGFKARYRYQIGSQTPNDLDSQIGTLWSTTDGFGELPPSLIQLWWEQHLFQNALVVTAGKLDANNFYNNYQFADDNNFFFNRAFSSNPARNHPDNGLGVNFLFKPVAPFYVSIGFQDAQGQATTTGFDTFGDGDYFYGVEVGMAPKIQGYGQGNYRLTFEYTDPIDRLGKPDEKFIGVSLDQEIGAGVIPFFRYSWTQGNVTNVKYLVATGFGFSGPLGRTNDFAGIAGSWGRAATGGRQSQWVFEAFYRFQLAPRLQFTPGYQLIVNPLEGSGDVVGIFEARLRVAF